MKDFLQVVWGLFVLVVIVGVLILKSERHRNPPPMVTFKREDDRQQVERFLNQQNKPWENFRPIPDLSKERIDLDRLLRKARGDRRASKVNGVETAPMPRTK